MTTQCAYCAETENLRPWGPGRAPICAACARADPERDAIARMYQREQRNQAQEQITKKLESVFPGLKVVFWDLSDLPDSDEAEPCQCACCSAKRAHETKHAN